MSILSVKENEKKITEVSRDAGWIFYVLVANGFNYIKRKLKLIWESVIQNRRFFEETARVAYFK